MFGFTRKTDYALVALAALAQQHRTAAAGPTSARQLAEAYSLPLPLLMQVLKDLHRAGILSSTRGAGGGYDLAAGPDQISLMSVIEAIEGPLRVAACCDDEPESEPCVACNLTERCPITLAVQRINDAMIDFLGKITIRDLIEYDGAHPTWPSIDQGLVSQPGSGAWRKD